MFVVFADHHGWWTVRELQQKSRVHLEHVIMKELYGKATPQELVPNASL
jgi:hypothetical protein